MSTWWCSNQKDHVGAGARRSGRRLPLGRRPLRVEPLEVRDLLSITIAANRLTIDCTDNVQNELAYHTHGVRVDTYEGWTVSDRVRVQVQDGNGAWYEICQVYPQNGAQGVRGDFVLTVIAWTDPEHPEEGSTIDLGGLDYNSSIFPTGATIGKLVVHVRGSEGPDEIHGATSSSTGQSKNVTNYISGLGGKDTIYGGAKDDVIVGGEGKDTIDPGGGADQVDLRDSLLHDVVARDPGDTLYPGNYVAPAPGMEGDGVWAAGDGAGDRIWYDTNGAPPPPSEPPFPKLKFAYAPRPVEDYGDEDSDLLGACQGEDGSDEAFLMGALMGVVGDAEDLPGEGGQMAGVPDWAALDSAYAEYGAAAMGIGDAGTRAADVAADAAGNLLMASQVDRGFSRGTDFVLHRLLEDGSPDFDFGCDGTAYADFGQGLDTPAKVLVQSDGGILVAGSTQTSSGSDFALVRFLDDGTLDPSFKAHRSRVCGLPFVALRTIACPANHSQAA